MISGDRILDWSCSPLDALRRWPRDRRVVFLHSGRPHPRWSRYSLIAEPVAAYRFEGDEPATGRSAWIGPPLDNAPAWTHRPFRDMRSVLQCDPQALWVGYLSYDLGRWVEHIAGGSGGPSHAANDRRWPIVQLQRCPGFLIHDNVTNRWTAHGSYMEAPPPLEAAPSAQPFTAPGDPLPATPREAYERAVARVIDYIAAGDAFQVNLAQRFSVPCEGDPRTLYARMAEQSPAWYAAYMELLNLPGETQRSLCSISPELFLDVEGRHVITRPIKGTRPAGVDPAELARSVKDTAELHMIVDLLRNDLGRVCDVGSVRVTNPREIESHPTVHHGVATIEGNLHRSKDIIDLLRATMPGGSITGAPKVRAMQIIDELEPVRRGPYCGAIGFIHGYPSQTLARFNIAIRTAMIEQDPAAQQGTLDFSVGGGIVADSLPAAEYQETLDKAAAILAALRNDAPT